MNRVWVLQVLAFCALLEVAGLAAAAETTRPPNDDGEHSTVRLNTNWLKHSRGVAACLAGARDSLEDAGYFTDPTEKAVFGLREGTTFAVRCDYKGVAFLVLAHRVRPEQAVQTQMMNDVLERLAKRLQRKR